MEIKCDNFFFLINIKPSITEIIRQKEHLHDVMDFYNIKVNIYIISLPNELSGYVYLDTVFFYVYEFVAVKYCIPVNLPYFYNPLMGFIHQIFGWNFISDGGS
jgi:hypothetical protein